MFNFNLYHLKEISVADVNDVQQAWRKDLGDEDVFALELEGMFRWCLDHTSQKQGDSRAHGMYTDNGVCHAIVEIVDTPETGTTKMLRLNLSPSLWNTADHLLDAANLYACAAYEVIKRGGQQGTPRVRLYARDELLYKVLHLVHDVLQKEEQTTIRSEFQGRWLSVYL